MGKIMDQGPVLIITFQAQLVMVIRNPKGEVVEGDPVSSWFSAYIHEGIWRLLHCGEDEGSEKACWFVQTETQMALQDHHLLLSGT